MIPFTTSRSIRCRMKPLHQMLATVCAIIATAAQQVIADLSFVTYPSSVTTGQTYKIEWQGADGDVRCLHGRSCQETQLLTH
jgi:hypothetical protein